MGIKVVAIEAERFVVVLNRLVDIVFVSQKMIGTPVMPELIYARQRISLCPHYVPRISEIDYQADLHLIKTRHVLPTDSILTRQEDSHARTITQCNLAYYLILLKNITSGEERRRHPTKRAHYDSGYRPCSHSSPGIRETRGVCRQMMRCDSAPLTITKGLALDNSRGLIGYVTQPGIP